MPSKPTASILVLPTQPQEAPKPPRTKPTLGIVIQARMGSKRFPGKILAKLGGKTVLNHVIDRCAEIEITPKINKLIIVAVPDKTESEPILQHLIDLEIEHFLGPEDNVLERYYGCAKFFMLDYIMRITADCPFLSPKIAEEVIHLFLWRDLDYCSNIFPKRTYPKGLDCEVFTFDCLEAAWHVAKQASESPAQTQEFPKQWEYDQEHVTPWMQRTKGIKRSCIEQKYNRSHQNLCVDYPGDIARLEKFLHKKPKLKVIK